MKLLKWHLAFSPGVLACLFFLCMHNGQAGTPILRLLDGNLYGVRGLAIYGQHHINQPRAM